MRSSPFPFFHLVHPNATTWTEVFGLISRVLNVPLVPYTKWLNALQELAQSCNRLSASPLQLLDFYHSANRPLYSEDDEAFGFPRLSTLHAEISVPALSNLTRLGVEDAASWLSYWSSIGALAKA